MISLVISILFLATIFIYLYSFRNDVLDPLVLFSLYTSFIPLSALLYNSQILGTVELMQLSSNASLTNALLFTFISYLIILISKIMTDQYMIKKSSNEHTGLYWSLIDQNYWIAISTIWTCNIIVISNFLLNLRILTGGDIGLFFRRVGYYASYAGEMGASTIGYSFGYISILIAIYLRAKRRLTISTFTVTFLIFVLSLLSQARITATITTLLAIYMIYLSIKGEKIRYLIIKLAFALTLAISLFTTRLLLEIKRVYPDTVINLSETTAISRGLFSELLGSGNLPNIFIVHNIMSLWPERFDYFWGTSALSSMLNIVPNPLFSQFLTDNTVSVYLYKNAYHEILGGSVPPTIFGEMYANFGPIGTVFASILLGLLLSFSSLLKNSRNLPYLIFYVFLNFYFIMILAKGETARITSMFPILLFSLTILLLKFLRNKSK